MHDEHAQEQSRIRELVFCGEFMKGGGLLFCASARCTETILH